MEWTTVLEWGLFITMGLALIPLAIWSSGVTAIKEDQVGLIVKKFGKPLQAGRIIAMDGEAGYQAEVLGPGWHFGFFPWQYKIEKSKTIVIEPGKLGLIVANDGAPMPAERILGKIVDCNNFQDPTAFLRNGGQKGKQLGILPAGTYRLNTALFEIAQLATVTTIPTDKIGIVTVADGAPIPTGEIAGAIIDGHNNYQNGEKFIQAGGQRGLQEQVLLAGSWNLNPWFVGVELAPLTEIPMGYVGVVISYVGKKAKDISGDSFKHGDLVERGQKGVWMDPLGPGKHALNTKTLRVEPVPTTNIALNWATNRSESHKLDEKLSSITVRSKDGFSFNLDVTQIIHVGYKEASKVICRFGSMKNLVDQVLEPAIGNYFRNSAQDYTVLDFLSKRTERQQQGLEYIRKALAEYNVEAEDTYIGDIVPPQAILQTLTDRKIAEEQQKTFSVQEQAQKQKQQLLREQSLAEKQKELVDAEQSVRVSEMKANQAIQFARGEAEAMKTRAKAEGEAIELKAQGQATALKTTALAEGDAARAKAQGESEAVKLLADAEAEKLTKIGEAQGKAYKLAAEGLGKEEYARIQSIKSLAENKVRLVPDTLIGTGSSGGMSMLDALLGKTLADNIAKTATTKIS